MRSTLLLTLIALSACAHTPPSPPAEERCLTLADHLRCRGANGSHYSEPYPGKRPRVCVPTGDAEARADYEAVIRQ
jgi:hypothetical protein